MKISQSATEIRHQQQKCVFVFGCYRRYMCWEFQCELIFRLKCIGLDQCNVRFNVDFSSASIFGLTGSLQLNKVIGRVESSVEQQ